jgi:AraC family transcriptional regulator of arabinose operon
MYTNSAYLHNIRGDIKDKSKPLIVTSCGTYRLYKLEKLPTYRPRGRLDYQLLYIVSGKVTFYIDGKEEVVSPGHMVLYRPKEVQKYEYDGIDQTQVYWVHFTGSSVKQILRNYGISDDMKIFYCGSNLHYQNLFRQMIQELQLRKEDFEELLVMNLRQLFILIHRQVNTINMSQNSLIVEEIDRATIYFNEHYNQNIKVEDYAASRYMSTSWFIRNFKEYTGLTPMQYILAIRIANAETLLQYTQYNITEIALSIGYDNPLYFSRIFKKQKGLSPTEYRKRIRE